MTMIINLGQQASHLRIALLEVSVENVVAQKVVDEPDLQVSEVVTALLNVVNRHQQHQIAFDIDTLLEVKRRELPS